MTAADRRVGGESLTSTPTTDELRLADAPLGAETPEDAHHDEPSDGDGDARVGADQDEYDGDEEGDAAQNHGPETSTTDIIVPEVVTTDLQLPPGVVPGVVDHWLRTYIPSTQGTYRSTVNKYEAVMAEPFEYLLASRQRCFAVASMFKSRLMESGAANATVNRHLAALRAFVDHCGPSGLGVVEWALKIDDLPSKAFRDTRGPGIELVRKMFIAANASPTPERDRALMAVLFGLALRRGEVAQLRLVDFDGERNALLVLGKGQGGQRVVVEMPAGVVEAVADWVAVRGTSPGALFLRAHTPTSSPSLAAPAPVVSAEWAARLARHIPGWTPETLRSESAPAWAIYSGRLTAKAIATIVASLGQAAGATGRVRPHGLRHTAITEAAKREKDLRKIKDFSRHKDIRTVGIYIDNLENFGLEIAQVVASDLLSETKPKPAVTPNTTFCEKV